jgi:hypothetical protein
VHRNAAERRDAAECAPINRTACFLERDASTKLRVKHAFNPRIMRRSHKPSRGSLPVSPRSSSKLRAARNFSSILLTLRHPARIIPDHQAERTRARAGGYVLIARIDSLLLFRPTTFARRHFAREFVIRSRHVAASRSSVDIERASIHGARARAQIRDGCTG